MRRTVQVLVFTALILALAGATAFGGGQGEGSGSGAQEGTADQTTITMWHFPQISGVPGHEEVSQEMGDWWEYVADRFMEENPDIVVQTEMQPWEGGVDKINVAIAGGNPPEIVFDYLGRSGGWFLQGASVPVDDLISQELEDDLLPSFRDLYLIDGELHAVPGFSWNQNINVNVGLLREWGYEGEILNGPGETYSTEEFMAFLREINEFAPTGSHPFGMAAGSEQGDYVWWGFFWGFDGFLYDEDGSVTDDSSGIIEGYDYIKTMNDEGLLAPGVASLTFADAINLWTSGRLAVLGGSKYHANLIRDAIDDGTLDIEYDVVPIPFPTESGDNGFSAIGPTGFSVFTDDQAKQEAAARFIEFAMQPERWASTVAGSGQFPATQSVAEMNIYEGDDYQEIIQGFLTEFEAGDFALSSPNYNEIRIALSSAGQAIFSDRKEIEEAVEDFLAEVRELEE